MTRNENLAEEVRRRPGLFFGSTQAFGVWQWLVYVVDEAVRGSSAGGYLEVVIRNGGCFQVCHDGPRTGVDDAALAACLTVRDLAGGREFQLDGQVLNYSGFSREAVANYLRDQAALTAGWRVTLRDERESPEVVQTFLYPQGLRELIQGSRVWELECYPFEGEVRGIVVQGAVCLGWRDLGVNILSYANRMRTLGGGAHHDGLLRGLKMLGQSVDGVLGAVAVTVDSPQYHGSTKDRLAGDDVEDAVAQVVIRSLKL